MFNNIFGSKKSASRTGFFKVVSETLTEINELPGNGSINDCIESLGFPTNHVRIVNIFDSNKIDCLGFETLSKKPVLVLTKLGTKISYADVQREINQIDWNFEYSSLNIEDILEVGIDMENFGLEFLQSVVDLKEDSKNVYKSEQLGLYLQFDNNVLTAFTTTGWANSDTKYLDNLNPIMVKEMTKEAKQHHQNDIDTMEEVNQQAKFCLDIPQGFLNEFIPLHSKENGTVNFYNLLITHYTKDCNIGDFVFMNKGRFRKINENTIEVGNFIYSFNTIGKLESIINK